MLYNHVVTQGRRIGQPCSVLGRYRRCGILMVKVVTVSGNELHLKATSLKPAPKISLDKTRGAKHNSGR
jgi:hypothetical protein